MYIPIVTKDDMKTHIYQGDLDEITRGDDDVIDSAIVSGIGEVRLYLSRYDPVHLFGDPYLGEEGVSADFTDPILTKICKDVIRWHCLTLGTSGIDFEIARRAYKDAIATLTQIMMGKFSPKWPYLDTTGQTAPKGNRVYVKSQKPDW